MIPSTPARLAHRPGLDRPLRRAHDITVLCDRGKWHLIAFERRRHHLTVVHHSVTETKPSIVQVRAVVREFLRDEPTAIEWES